MYVREITRKHRKKSLSETPHITYWATYRAESKACQPTKEKLDTMLK